MYGLGTCTSKPSSTSTAPISRMKASASILMVGLASMKLPSGLAASSMIATATSTATTITGIWSAMPTAVITESSENTMSITAIWAITTQNTCEAMVVRGSSSWPPLISSRISMTPFTSRKAPPTIRIRSRTEMPMPPMWNSSVCMRARKASETSRQMRVMQATAMPNLRAKARFSAGSRPTAIEMNTRLSMPSTISSALRVTRVSQTFGSARNSKLIGGFPVVTGSKQARAQDQGPARQHVHHQHEDRGRAHVLGPSRQHGGLGAVALDHGLDRRVQQLGRQHQQHRADQQRTLHAVLSQPQRHRRQDHEQVDLQPERGLVAPGGGQTLQGPLRGAQHPARTARKVAGDVSHGGSLRGRA